MHNSKIKGRDLRSLYGLFLVPDSDSDSSSDKDSCTMQDFSISLDSDPFSHDLNVCNRDEDLCLEQRSVSKLGTVPTWERDPNLNPSQWKYVLHNSMLP